VISGNKTNPLKVQIADVCRIGNGYAFKSPEYRDNGIPLLRISNITNERISFDKGTIYLDENCLVTHKDFVVNKGDVLIALSGATTGKYGIYELEEPCLLNQRIGIIRSGNSKSLDSKYFYFYLSELRSEILRKAQGAAQPNISTKEIGQFKIPLPPLPEQQKIASILDAADNLRQKDQQLIKKYNALSQSLFLDMFGDPVTNPMGWEMGTSIEYCDCIVPGRDKPKSFSGDIPWVTTNDLNRLTYTSKSKKDIGLTEEEVAEVRAKIIPENSVILTCVGDLGVISINSSPVVINQQLHAFQCDHINISPIFMMYVLSYQTPFMYKMASSTTVPYMNKTVCNNIPMIYPPITLQNQFAERIQLIEAQKQLALASLEKSEALFNSLLQRAFKGELTA